MLTPSNSGYTKRKKKARALREKEEGSFDRHINVIQQSSFSPDYRSLCAALYLNIAVIFFNIHYYYYLFIHFIYIFFLLESGITAIMLLTDFQLMFLGLILCISGMSDKLCTATY